MPDSKTKATIKSGDYEFIRLYRTICQHYALAKQRHYSPALVSRLHEQVIAGHQMLYQHQTHVCLESILFRYTFPIRLRQYANLAQSGGVFDSCFVDGLGVLCPIGHAL